MLTNLIALLALLPGQTQSTGLRCVVAFWPGGFCGSVHSNQAAKMVGLRTETAGDVEGSIPMSALAGLKDMAWDASSDLIFLLRFQNGRTTVSGYGRDGKLLANAALEAGIVPESRLFRQSQSICFLAVGVTSRVGRCMVRLGPATARIEQKWVQAGIDFDERLSAKLARSRREALVRIAPKLPVRYTDVIDDSTGRSGSLPEQNTRLGTFPVVLGNVSYPVLAFNSQTSAAIFGTPAVTCAVFTNKVWKRKDLRSALSLKLTGRRGKVITMESAYIEQRRAIIGVLVGSSNSAKHLMVKVDLSDRNMRIGEVLSAIYVAPIARLSQ